MKLISTIITLVNKFLSEFSHLTKFQLTVVQFYSLQCYSNFMTSHFGHKFVKNAFIFGKILSRETLNAGSFTANNYKSVKEHTWHILRYLTVAWMLLGSLWWLNIQYATELRSTFWSGICVVLLNLESRNSVII